MQFALEYVLRNEDELKGAYCVGCSFLGEDTDHMHLNQFHHGAAWNTERRYRRRRTLHHRGHSRYLRTKCQHHPCRCRQHLSYRRSSLPSQQERWPSSAYQSCRYLFAPRNFQYRSRVGICCPDRSQQRPRSYTHRRASLESALRRRCLAYRNGPPQRTFLPGLCPPTLTVRQRFVRIFCLGLVRS